MIKFLLSITLAISTIAAAWATVQAPEIGGIYYELDDETLEGKVMGCKTSGSIVIPGTVTYDRVTYTITTIAFRAFAEKKNVTQVTLNEGLTTIEGQAFNKSGIISITLPESLTTIGSSAFYEATSLNRIVIPDGVTSIGDRAFTGCSSLEQIKLPAGITTIREFMFGECKSLKALNIPKGVVDIGNYAIINCDNLTSLTLPGTLHTLAAGSIANCPKLSSIALPKSLRYIGENTLSNLGITTISIPEGVTTIEDYAMSENQYIASASIPSTVTAIGSVFTDCGKLQRVYNRMKTIITPGYEGFTPELFESQMHLIVPRGMKDLIDEETLWYYFPIITEEVACDVDASGIVDVSDVNEAINTLLQRGNPVNAAGADVNCDGLVDISDVSLIINKMLSK